MSLKELSQAFGVSGYEHEVRDLIRSEAAPFADSIEIDAIGNLIVFKRGSIAEKKKIMMAAHMDEIGLQVTKIDDRGFIRFQSLGYHFPSTLLKSRVRFRNGIIGFVSSTMDEDKLDVAKMHIDIGTGSKEETQKALRIGDVAAYIGEYCELSEGTITAKALDNRIGCHILLQTLKRIETPKNDLYFVFTVQEELGCRGSKTASAKIRPDIGIAVDITPAHDYPCDLEGSNRLGGGVCIKISDPSVICEPQLVDEMTRCCEDYGIAHQFDVITKGGTDASSINTSNEGVRVAGVSVATRYSHGHSAFAKLADIDASIELLARFVERTIVFQD